MKLVLRLLRRKKRNSYFSAFCFYLTMSLCTGAVNAQYIHPNQAGQAGGNTSSPGVGNQVVVSTYLGRTGSDPTFQGTVFVSSKEGTDKFAVTDFAGFPNDGSYPFYTTPHQATDGNLYGTSFVGGTANLGAVYKYDLSSGVEMCEKTIIHNNAIGDGASGAGNYANVNELSDGKLYVVYTYGGSTGYGQVIRMNKDGSGVEVLKNFSFSLATVPYTPAAALNAGDGITPLNSLYHYDGAYPYGFVVEGADGKVYGSCVRGGYFNGGMIWRMEKDGTNFEVIHACDTRFLYTRPDGLGVPIVAGSYGIVLPWGNVAQDQLGRIYFTGYYGGQGDLGGLSRMNADGSNVQILVSGSLDNGTRPYRGPLIIDNNVYGTFRYDGGGTSIGVVWKYDILTSAYSKLKTFNNDNSDFWGDGGEPWAGVAYDGNFLFGTCLAYGGAGKIGTLWKIKPDGTDFQVLHRFSEMPGEECEESSPLYAYYPSAERVTFANVSNVCTKSCTEEPLSLNGIDFNAQAIGCSTHLIWVTEGDVNKFDIEKSSDGIHFNYVTTITAVNGKVSQKYTHLLNQDEEVSYYRIKIYDNTERHRYSEVRKVRNNCMEYYVKTYPNPSASGKGIHIKYRLQYEGNVVMQVFNSIGQMVQSFPLRVDKDVATETPINLNVAAGLYYFTLLTEDGKSIAELQKLMIVNN